MEGTGEDSSHCLSVRRKNDVYKDLQPCVRYIAGVSCLALPMQLQGWMDGCPHIMIISVPFYNLLYHHITNMTMIVTAVTAY